MGVVEERGDAAASAWSAGLAAVQRAELTTWGQATPLKRVWDVDALRCEGCGGKMRLIAVIKERAVIERIVRHIGEEAEEPAVRVGARSMRRVGASVATEGDALRVNAAPCADQVGMRRRRQASWYVASKSTGTKRSPRRRSGSTGSDSPITQGAHHTSTCDSPARSTGRYAAP